RLHGRAELVLEHALLRITTLADLVSLREVLERLHSSADSGRASASASPAPAPAKAAAGLDLFGAPASGAATRIARASRAIEGGSDPRDIPAVPGVPPRPPGAPPDPPPDLARAKRCLAETSATIARAVGDRLAFSEDGLALRLPLSGVLGRQMDAEKRDALRAALEREFGRPVRVEVVADPAPSTGADGAAPPASEAGNSEAGEATGSARAGLGVVPEIVEKAREIFRGTVRPAGAPRAPQAKRPE
ncbi:MAG: hypothetical protein L0Z55_02445, partial [Planctomycetes bacterium]|nr:hypothetical protein [Planctomycetota bacterium]